MTAPQLLVADLGTLPFTDALEVQRAVARARISGAVAEDVLLLVEHPPVVTLGRASKAHHLVAPPETLVARVGLREVVIPVAAVTLLEADGVYTAVHVSGRRHLVRRSLDELERVLGPAHFLRVHRSYLVRRSAVVEARLSAGVRRRELVLTGGTAVPVSRRRQADVLRALHSA